MIIKMTIKKRKRGIMKVIVNVNIMIVIIIIILMTTITKIIIIHF